MAEPGEQTRAGSALPGLLIPGLVPPLLGVLAFALLRESYSWFYGRYGVIPEDVGISQIRMLTGVLRMFHLWSLPIPGPPGGRLPDRPDRHLGLLRCTGEVDSCRGVVWPGERERRRHPSRGRSTRRARTQDQ
jgi:hypothetical protein